MINPTKLDAALSKMDAVAKKTARVRYVTGAIIYQIEGEAQVRDTKRTYHEVNEWLKSQGYNVIPE